MPTHELPNRLVEFAIIAFPTSVMSVIGWFAYTVTKYKRFPDTPVFVGGVLLAAFVGWVSCMTLLASGMEPEVCATVASVIGATGKDGFEYLVKKNMEKDRR